MQHGKSDTHRRVTLEGKRDQHPEHRDLQGDKEPPVGSAALCWNKMHPRECEEHVEDPTQKGHVRVGVKKEAVLEPRQLPRCLPAKQGTKPSDDDQKHQRNPEGTARKSRCRRRRGAEGWQESCAHLIRNRSGQQPDSRLPRSPGWTFRGPPENLAAELGGCVCQSAFV